MQRLLIKLALLLLFILTAYGCAGNKPPVDRDSGYPVRQDTPLNAAVSFHTLLGSGSYEASYQLLTPASRLNTSPGEMEQIQNTVRLEGSRVLKAEGGPVKGGLAVVALLRSHKFEGVKGEVILASLEILKRDGSRWYVAREMDEFDQGQTRDLLEMLIPFEEKLLESEDFFAGLTPEQRASAMKQLDGFLAGHRMMLNEMILYQEGSK
jgi:hypothetical protein